MWLLWNNIINVGIFSLAYLKLNWNNSFKKKCKIVDGIPNSFSLMMYQNRPDNIEDRKDRIRMEIINLPAESIRNALDSIYHRLGECQVEGGVTFSICYIKLNQDDMKLENEIRLISACIYIIFLQKVEAILLSAPPIKSEQSAKPKASQQVLKASFTQKGYIQFLRYVVDVPELTDYTFCIWVRSNNLTYNHPLLSYSKHEEERLLRVWISPMGSHINLEILDVPIFSIPVHFLENEWYHICQSWSSSLAAWSLYLNGKLKANGFAPKLKKVPIKSGGDIIVGQEYTDFDKGLDDGIEGDVSGFNFVLGSTFNNENLKHQIKPLQPLKRLFKRAIKDRGGTFHDAYFDENKHFYPVVHPLRDNRRKLLSRREVWDKSLESFSRNKLVPPLPLDTSHEVAYKPQVTTSQKLPDYLRKPLGLILVQLSHDCGYLRGAPLSDKGVLVSWTKSRVRVFGGAILKTVPPFCIK